MVENIVNMIRKGNGRKQHKNIVNHIKAQKLSWFGHVQRMPDTRTVKKIFKWKPPTKRSQGRPKYRWEDNIKQDRLFQIINVIHISFILQQYVCYTMIFNMFRAARCSSSGGQPAYCTAAYRG